MRTIDITHSDETLRRISTSNIVTSVKFTDGYNVGLRKKEGANGVAFKEAIFSKVSNSTMFDINLEGGV